MIKKNQKVVLYYDGDCVFCTACATLGKRLPLRVQFTPMQSVDLVSLGVDPVRARTEVPSLLDGGTVVYGHRAIAAVLETGALPFKFVGQVSTWGPMDRLSAWIYRLVSQHRQQLSKASSSCQHAFVTLKEAGQRKPE